MVSVLVFLPVLTGNPPWACHRLEHGRSGKKNRLSETNGAEGRVSADAVVTTTGQSCGVLVETPQFLTAGVALRHRSEPPAVHPELRP